MQIHARRTVGQAVSTIWNGRQHGTTSKKQRSLDTTRTFEAPLQHAIAIGEYTQALEMLLEHYQHAIVSYCYSSFPDMHFAQEIAQEVFLAAFEGMARFRGASSVKTWLYGIASKKCLEAGRTRARREALVRDNKSRISAQAHCDPPREPDALFSQERQRQRVWQALRRLRVYDRELLVLRHLEELTCDEIANILKVSRRTVERHLPRAEAKFHKAYQKVQEHGTHVSEA